MSDARYMRMALKEALKGQGRTSPNPSVGAVIVKGNRVVGKGYHRGPGNPHAEVEALDACKSSPRGATIYVTLEPCCHLNKRTPPCTNAIIASGITRVVVGAIDPNPLVRGQGIAMLRDIGIEVLSGVLKDECERSLEGYSKLITEKLPFITIKLAQTLDARIATSTGESRWITGDKARRCVHTMRSVVDAVMVGSKTVLKDDPELTVRGVPGSNPVRVVVDSAFSSPLGAKVFLSHDNDKGGPILVTTKDAPATKLRRIMDKGVRVVVVRRAKEGLVLRDALKNLGRLGIAKVLVEGGSTMSASLIKEGLADKLSIFVAPKLIGSDGVPSIGGLSVKKIGRVKTLDRVTVKRMGDDLLVEGYLK